MNAEELAASIYAKMQRSHEREMYSAAKDLLGSGYIGEYYISAASDFLSISSSAIEHACAISIREVAQPIADERDELREALKWMVKEAEFKEKVARDHGYLGGLTVDEVMECLADVQGFVLPPVMRQRVRSRLTAKAKGE